MDESMRSLEIYQTNPVDSCEQCFFRRSNAIRRKGRRVISTRATFRRSPHFQKCVNQNQTDKVYRYILKRLRILQMKKIRIKSQFGVKFLKKKNRLSKLFQWNSAMNGPQPKTVGDPRIAQVDNGFFEKFGSLFREQAEMAQTREQVEKEQVAEAAAQLVPKEDDDEEPETPPASVDSETSSSDSQIDENEFENDFIATAFNPAAYWWCENFGPEANQLLTQHIAQSGLSPTEVALCSYSVYAGIHQSHPLSFCIFSKLLEKLLKPLQTEMILEEDMKLFWEATRKLLPSCFAVIRRIRKKNANEKTVMKQVIEVLKIFNYVMALEPTNIDLFPQNLYPWITFHGDDPNCDIAGTLQDAISKGAGDWLNYLIENNKATAETALARLQNLIQLLQLVRSDLQKAIEFYDKLFIEHVNFQYAKSLYIFYQAKISTLCEPEVRQICKNLKTLDYSGYDFGNGPVNTDPTVDPLAEGTSLFDLYLTIQRFVILGQGICPSDYNGFHIKNFHQWFHAGVAQWLDIAVYKALQRIEKAIELDQLVHIDTSVKYSSSAVDTLTIFYQVNTFWQQLNWPDVESCYTFIAKIIDDICRCCIFYAEKMASKVDGMGDIENIYEKKFEVTNEWCLAINNIDYVRETLEPFTNDLGMEEILKKILELKSPVDAQRCRDTLNMVISNAIDTVRNAIIELLQTVVQKMAPSMKRLLIEGAELCNQDNNSIDRLMSYVDRNLETMHRELNEENFNRTLEIVWDMLSQTLDEIIQTNLENRRPPSFFANLQKTLKLMLGAYKDPTDCTSCDSLKRTEQILRINGLETSDLIHEVHLELAKKFDELPESPYGEISFRCKFDGDVLQVEVINARDLAAMDSSGASDSFVRIHLLPEHKFSSIDKPKTKTHNKTLFPLYDETFTINLSPEQREIKDGLVLLSVKDKDMLGYNNQYIGEAFLRFKDIPITSESLSNLPQVKKWLGRPTSFEMDTIKALEHRLGDKQAKEFLKKFKQRLAS
ncbi:protein unc-13 homolog 4B isoform X8 [Dendroctonus ponderosae]|uniref:protein unc-13 homolog 4B isoform X8 n=1 Tax=Dendroctonus ponderosae TaxID=77166 RepID=UPI0020351B25|nr:protein unc-13 homolog 4B isoform X8 [Dendroctonus ponderosae]